MIKAGFASDEPLQSQFAETASAGNLSDFEPPAIEQLAELFSQIEVLELLGKGGMGAVYKARQPALDRLVAVKILPPEIGRNSTFAERFTREARALARLSHPNIVAIHDIGQADELLYFVMEYVDGVNLRQAIQAGLLTQNEALAVVPQICDALQYAHDAGIVHRDIKPENILLDKRGQVKIADFGLSKILQQEWSDLSLTGTQQVMGTLRYMAPEQLQKTRTVDHRADIYSLGVVFYELLTGEVPMGHFDPPSSKIEIDVKLDKVVLRALAREPDKRYQQANELKTDVQATRSLPAPAQTEQEDRSSVVPELLLRRLAVTCGILTLISAVLTTLLITGVLINSSNFDAFFRSDAFNIPAIIAQALSIPVGMLMLISGLLGKPDGAGGIFFSIRLGFVPLTPAWLFVLPLGFFILKNTDGNANAL